ncbi:PleD family two-component system response regulator [Thiocapsa sp.]|uniref:response regulator n=1 Tax=Thiocapsa sp. TaxID=2024551 RepID=UPI0035932AB9
MPTAADPSLSHPQPDPPAVAGVARSDVRILLAADRPAARCFATKLLRDSGYRVEVAVDGFDVLGMLAEVKPDLLLLDGRMPRLDGFQVCALVKRHPGFAAMPVLILSDGGSLFARVRARLAGAWSCLPKPFTAEELLQAVSSALVHG